MSDLNGTVIGERMRAAARCLRVLPSPENSGAKGFGKSWPDFVQDTKRAFDARSSAARVSPSPAEIAAMEEALEWLALVPHPGDRRLIWARAEGRRWRDIAKEAGLSRGQCWARWSAASRALAEAVAKRKKPARKGAGSE